MSEQILLVFEGEKTEPRQEAGLPMSYRRYAWTLSQINIFSMQKMCFIDPKSEIAVLSGFPFFIVDYLGERFWLNSLCAGQASSRLPGAGQCSFND